MLSEKQIVSSLSVISDVWNKSWKRYVDQSSDGNLDDFGAGAHVGRYTNDDN